MAAGEVIVLVTHTNTMLNDTGDELARIISARKASPGERREYEQFRTTNSWRSPHPGPTARASGVGRDARRSNRLQRHPGVNLRNSSSATGTHSDASAGPRRSRLAPVLGKSRP
jgi:hypothetical protein